MLDALRLVSSCSSSISFHHPFPHSFLFSSASKFTRFRHKGASLFARILSCRFFPRVPLFAISNTDGPADNLPPSIDRSSSRSHLVAYVFLARVSLDIFHVRLNVEQLVRLASSRELRPLLDFHPLMLEELFSLLSLPPYSSLFSPVRNSDSFQGNVYPRWKIRLKCIGACFPRRARAISTRILWVYYMTASYLGIHAYRCKDFRKTRNLSLRSTSQMFSVKFWTV